MVEVIVNQSIDVSRKLDIKDNDPFTQRILIAFSVFI